MQALWMVLGAFFFASMAVCVKIASAWFNSAELVFYRGVVSVVFVGLLARRQGVSLRTAFPGMHAWRSLVGVTSLGAWFYAIAGLPLATAMTLNYMSSVWVAAFLVAGTLMVWDPRRGPGPLMRQGPLTLAVLAGFAGVVLVLQPSMRDDQQVAGLVGLMSGFTAALAFLQVAALAKVGEPDTRTVFYFSVGSTVAGALGMAVAGVSAWDWSNALWLLPVGVLASLGQLCMTRAYSRGATLVVACLQYFGIVFGALYALLLFGEAISPAGWLGMGLIVASGILATVLRARAAPGTPADDH
jgi:S-adenosylmethionine uptake transporter